MEISQNIQSLVTAAARESGFEIGNEASSQRVLDTVSEALKRYTDKPITFYGHRVEAMFQFVAASLGQIRTMVQEDAGSVLSIEEQIRPPDYRILLKDDTAFFVEVKNCNTVRLDKGIAFKREYADSLHRYAAMFGQEVKVAVYWSRMSLWTLVSLSKFEAIGDKVVLTMEQAFKRNEMALLGDVHIGTTAPLVMRLSTDPSKPRQINPDGETEFTIGDVSFYAAGQHITDPFESKLCYFLMMFGKWLAEGPEYIVNNNEVIAVEMRCSPVESVPDQGFDLMGASSSMIARHFDCLSASGSTVNRLSPTCDPSKLGFHIPRDFKGQQLKLWQCLLSPNYN